MVQYLIGVDVGTTGIKAGLFRLDGSMEASAYRETNLYYPRPDAVEQYPQEFYEGVCACVKDMMRASAINPADVAALSIDGQMAGILGIDEDWNAVTNYDSWLDNRCKGYVDYITENHCTRVLEICGLPPATSHCAKILWWQNEQKEVFKRIAKFIQPAAYVAGKLAGLKAKDAYIDYTYLHFSGLSDAVQAVWSGELLQAMGGNYFLYERQIDGGGGEHKGNIIPQTAEAAEKWAKEHLGEYVYGAEFGATIKETGQNLVQNAPSQAEDQNSTGIHPDQNKSNQSREQTAGQNPEQYAFEQNPAQSPFYGGLRQRTYTQNPQQNASGQNQAQNSFGQNPAQNTCGRNPMQNAFQNPAQNYSRRRPARRAYMQNTARNPYGQNHQMPNAFGWNPALNGFGQNPAQNAFGQFPAQSIFQRAYGNAYYQMLAAHANWQAQRFGTWGLRQGFNPFGQFPGMPFRGW